MDREEQLKQELEKYERKLAQLKKDCAEFKAGGSRYGDEYGEIQIKVYEQMISDVRKELLILKS